MPHNIELSVSFKNTNRCPRKSKSSAGLLRGFMQNPKFVYQPHNMDRNSNTVTPISVDSFPLEGSAVATDPKWVLHIIPRSGAPVWFMGYLVKDIRSNCIRIGHPSDKFQLCISKKRYIFIVTVVPMAEKPLSVQRGTSRVNQRHASTPSAVPNASISNFKFQIFALDLASAFHLTKRHALYNFPFDDTTVTLPRFVLETIYDGTTDIILPDGSLDLSQTRGRQLSSSITPIQAPPLPNSSRGRTGSSVLGSARSASARSHYEDPVYRSNRPCRGFMRADYAFLPTKSSSGRSVIGEVSGYMPTWLWQPSTSRSSAKQVPIGSWLRMYSTMLCIQSIIASEKVTCNDSGLVFKHCMDRGTETDTDRRGSNTSNSVTRAQDGRMDRDGNDSKRSRQSFSRDRTQDPAMLAKKHVELGITPELFQLATEMDYRGIKVSKAMMLSASESQWMSRYTSSVLTDDLISAFSQQATLTRKNIPQSVARSRVSLVNILIACGIDDVASLVNDPVVISTVRAANERECTKINNKIINNDGNMENHRVVMADETSSMGKMTGRDEAGEVDGPKTRTARKNKRASLMSGDFSAIKHSVAAGVNTARKTVEGAGATMRSKSMRVRRGSAVVNSSGASRSPGRRNKSRGSRSPHSPPPPRSVEVRDGPGEGCKDVTATPPTHHRQESPTVRHKKLHQHGRGNNIDLGEPSRTPKESVALRRRKSVATGQDGPVVREKKDTYKVAEAKAIFERQYQ